MALSGNSMPFHLFEDKSDVLIIERRLPHSSQAGAVSFITWRTADSMPKAVVDRWHADRAACLNHYGIDPTQSDWRQQFMLQHPEAARNCLDPFWNRWEDELDSCHGACVLRQPELARIVRDSLLHFDGDRYLILDFVVTPNHAHLLAAFADEDAMLNQCESWKRYTATQINRRLKQHGRFWQSDAFDHLVRTEKQFEYLRGYIANNGIKAKLRPGEYVHYSRT